MAKGGTALAGPRTAKEPRTMSVPESLGVSTGSTTRTPPRRRRARRPSTHPGSVGGSAESNLPRVGTPTWASRLPTRRPRGSRAPPVREALRTPSTTRTPLRRRRVWRPSTLPGSVGGSAESNLLRVGTPTWASLLLTSNPRRNRTSPLVRTLRSPRRLRRRRSRRSRLTSRVRLPVPAGTYRLRHSSGR